MGLGAGPHRDVAAPGGGQWRASGRHRLVEDEDLVATALAHNLGDHLGAAENAHPARVYVAGVSSGGFLVPRIACEMGDKVAAVADAIATSRQAVFRSCNPRQVPFALIASTTDPINRMPVRPGTS